MDEDDREDGSARNPAPQLSREFLSGGTVAGLERIRSRLLDLTNRNRLLNFRHTAASSIRIVDVALDLVFAQLLDGEELLFRAVPEPLRMPVGLGFPETENDKPTAADHAEALGWKTSYDLTVPSEHNADSRFLPVLHYIEDLEALTRKIGSAANTVIEESGTNMLYVTLGFLEWYESDDSRQAHSAPLVALPVCLNRPTTKGKGFTATLEYSGEDIASNLSLIEKMRRDFAVDIPSLEEDDTPEAYFARFDPILAQRPRWRIRRQITVSLLSFGKLLMYRDLDPKVWPGIARHPLISELFEGRKNDTIARAEEYSIDSPEFNGKLPPLVVDADSSQHSALIDALRGKNLVIEGPPGTGKSQTITNLIAGALASGKTVLFVSEKLAALEVVRHRLDEAGLGLFCLELHSHKTRKDSLLKDLERRLKADGSFSDPRDLDRQIGIVDEKKRLLTRYAALINEKLQTYDSTVFEVLWARDRAYQELPFDRTLVEAILLPTLVQFTRVEVVAAEQFLSVYAQHLVGVQRAGVTLEDHSWAWVAGPLSFQSQERICDLLEQFIATSRDVRPHLLALAGIAGVALNESLTGLSTALEILAALPNVDAGVPRQLLAPCRDVRVRAALAEFVGVVEGAAAAGARLAGATSQADAASILREGVGDALSRAAASLVALGYRDDGMAQLREHLEQGRSTERRLADGKSAFSVIADRLGVPAAFDTESVGRLINGLCAIDKAPLEVLYLRSPQLESEGVDRILRTAAERANALSEQHHGLNDRFDLSTVLDATDGVQLRAHACAIQDASLWQRWFGGDYRAARRAFKRGSRGDLRVSRHEMAQDFRALADYQQARKRFESDGQYRRLLGDGFKGVETNWSDVQRLVGWYQEVFTLLPEVGGGSVALREFLLRSRTEDIAGAKAWLATQKDGRAALAQLPALIADLAADLGVESGREPIEELQARLASANARLDQGIGTMRKADLGPDVTVGSVPDLLTAAATYRAGLAQVEAQEGLRNLLGDLFQGLDTDFGPVLTALRFAESVLNSAIPTATAAWLLSEEYFSRLGQLRQWLELSVRAYEDISRIRAEVRTLAASSDWHPDESELLEPLVLKAERAVNRREELAQWLHFQRARAESAKAGSREANGPRGYRRNQAARARAGVQVHFQQHSSS